jgi:hypothetical protein
VSPRVSPRVHVNLKRAGSRASWASTSTSSTAEGSSARRITSSAARSAAERSSADGSHPHAQSELDDPAGKDIEDIRPIRDDIERRVRALMTELGVEPIMHQRPALVTDGFAAGWSLAQAPPRIRIPFYDCRHISAEPGPAGASRADLSRRPGLSFRFRVLSSAPLAVRTGLDREETRPARSAAYRAVGE